MNPDFSEPMDPSLLQLERELQSLTPAAPGRDLLRALQARMEPLTVAPEPPAANKVYVFPWRRMMTPAAAAAAAAVAVMSIQNGYRRPGVAATDTPGDHADAHPSIKWEPMPMRSEYRALLDAGYVLDDHAVPVKQFYMNSVDHHEWRSPGGNSSVRLTIPRQERVLVPAALEDRESRGTGHHLQFQ